MLNIKEIALNVADSLRNKIDGISHMQSNQGLVRFAEALVAELAKQNEPVESQYKGSDGSWKSFDSKDHESNTRNSGEWEVRDLFTYPPTAEQIANERYPDKTRSLQYLFTSDQVAAAIIKATKPLEGEIERLKQQSANRLIGLCKGGEDNDELRAQLAKAEQLWQIAQGRCDGLEEKLAKAEQRVAEACALACEDVIGNTANDQRMIAAIDCSAMIHAGEWRKFVKEV